MLQDYFFLAVALLGVVALVPVIIVLIVGTVKNSRKAKIVGLCLSIIPILCFSAYYWYWNVKVPALNEQNILKYSGIYEFDRSPNIDSSDSRRATFHLILNSDKTFKIDKTPYISFQGTGKWHLTDGGIQFEDSQSTSVGWASLGGQGAGEEKVIFNFNDRQKHIEFVKRK
jgi:hypothetical protein